jgi:1-acyl-sn-glycerol-3-phosphate acyltransferase
VLYAFLKPFAVLAMRWLFRLESVGRQHVPAAGPVLLVSNHLSVLDPPLVGGASDRQLSFLAKAELFRIPLFGWLIRALNARPLRREGADASALREALRMLGEGRALLVFPEGTRGREGDGLRAAKAGAGMLAVLSGAPVVPVYITGSGHAWPRGRRLPRRSRVTVRFGPPLSFAGDEGRARKERYAEASRVMMAAIAQLRDQATGVAANRVPWRALEAVRGAGHQAQGPTQNS